MAAAGIGQLSRRGGRAVPGAVKRWVASHLWDRAGVFGEARGFPRMVRSPEHPEGLLVERSTPVVFHHIPKTAGSSLRRVLEAMFDRRRVCPAVFCDDELRRIPGDRLASYGFFGGHFTFDGLSSVLPGAIWLTLLRDPVERVVSHYHQATNPGRQSAQWRAWAGRRESLRAYLAEVEGITMEAYLARTDRRTIAATTNLQTRVIAGPSVCGGLGDPLCRGGSAAVLGRAKQHLRDRYAFVGVQESFEGSLALLGQTFGLGPPRRSFRANINPARRGGDRYSLSAEARAMIVERNRLDAELHAYAGGLVAERARALGCESG